jgi:hypothetical protein
MTNQIQEFADRLTEEVKTDPFFEGRDDTPTYRIDTGARKYARIIMTSCGQGSAWGFIEVATGNILKAAGWKSPARHPRGNIATSEYGRGYTWTGPAYLR